MTIVKKGARLTGEDRIQIARRVTSSYQQGHSIRKIAAEMGRSYGFVHRLLSESELDLRARGGVSRRPGD